MASSGGMPPMMGGSSVPMAEKRILGAIFPLNGAGYFLKITDSITRIEGIKESFPKIVAEFKTDPDSGKPVLDLPAGWEMLPGDAFAEAKVAIPLAGQDKPAIMTISKLAAPAEESAWPDYLLMQLNRWNGQVAQDNQTLDELMASIQPVPREGSKIPAYIFDKNGSMGKSESPNSLPPSDASSPATVAAPKQDASMPADHGSATETKAFDPSTLRYELPEGWEKLPDRAFRIATFRVPGGESQLDGEIVISQAVDNPLENSKMWSEQVLKTDDPSILGPKAEETVSRAETIPAGKREAKLYTIRANDEKSGLCLMIAVIPMEGFPTSMFVKLRSTIQLAEQQKSNLLRFIDSMRWE
jgi:hypothetical protein